MKLLTLVGARPQIIKAAALSRTIRKHFQKELTEYILHTGQHYDENMSQVFFDELNIPKPDFNLEVGSGLHGVQTAKMIEGIERILLELKPDYLVVYGDTNSTLAGAVAASKSGVEVVHIEAGLRSFDKRMPEEINRIACDHVSTLLFSPTSSGIKNLIREGFNEYANPPFDINNPAVFHCGDVMYDNSIYFAGLAKKQSEVLTRNHLRPNDFILCTIHRDSNTDDSRRLTAIFDALNSIARERQITIILPLHPRTGKMMKHNLPLYLYVDLFSNPFLKMIPPVSFLDMIQLEKNARLIVTDSGGVQKEAYFFSKPSIILRPQTEWVELVENGTAILADADKSKIEDAVEYFMSTGNPDFPSLFGDGKAAEFICNTMIKSYYQTKSHK
ncbi:MAG: UDP-N-acetylglucosamine 2-epimerase (non-hydrolyzing) [Bacteroidales bacterium]|nr:UDP-N-acetylglucosamine 2-epimerase (non-hydrolyzing) [Bacteroidales bacterium]